MSKISQNSQKVNSPIRFELVDDDPEKTVGDFIFGKILHTTGFFCRRCKVNVTILPNDFCDDCIDDIVNDEGE